MSQGIYLITNRINGHQYVGQSINIEKRWKGHKTELHHGTHYNYHLQNAWNKYKVIDFVFSVVEIVKLRVYLNERERYWFNQLKPIYNIAHSLNGNEIYDPLKVECIDCRKYFMPRARGSTIFLCAECNTFTMNPEEGNYCLKARSPCTPNRTRMPLCANIYVLKSDAVSI